MKASFRTPIAFTVAAAISMIALLAPDANASAFTVRQVRAQSDEIDSLSKATRLLDGTLPAAGETISSASLINFVDPQSPSRGRFGDEVALPADVAFPGNLAGDDNNFAIVATGNVVIPSAGLWTIGVHADNGVRVRIGSYIFSRSGFDSSSLLRTFNFTAPGTYPLELTYYEHTGQSGIELFAGPGTITSGSNSSLRLIGDTANGGLVVAPEPTGILPLALLAALLMRRRVKG